MPYQGNLVVFLLLVVLCGGGAAYAMGRAVALSWQSRLKLIFYSFLLALFVRFLHFSLFEGALFSSLYLFFDFGVLLILAVLGYRFARFHQMRRHYGFLKDC